MPLTEDTASVHVMQPVRAQCGQPNRTLGYSPRAPTSNVNRRRLAVETDSVNRAICRIKTSLVHPVSVYCVKPVQGLG